MPPKTNNWLIVGKVDMRTRFTHQDLPVAGSAWDNKELHDVKKCGTSTCMTNCFA